MCRTRDLGDGFIDTGVHAQRQAIAGGINLLNQTAQIVAGVTHNVQYRTEHLFLQFVEAFQLDKRRRDKGTALPFTRIVAVFARGLEHRTTFGAHGLNMALNIGFGFLIDYRSNIGGQAARVTHAAFRHCATQHFQRMVGDIVLQAQDAKRGAALSGAVKGRSQNVDHDLFR